MKIVSCPYPLLSSSQIITQLLDRYQGGRSNKLDSENKAKHEEILKKLKEGLPECYEVESEIDEENNTITIKITTKNKDEKSKKEAKELAMKIVDKLKKVEKI